jgi:hypothetical protein
MRSVLVVAMCVIASPAVADKKSLALTEALDAVFGHRTEGSKLPAIALLDSRTELDRTEPEPLIPSMEVSYEPLKAVIAFSADGSAGWIGCGLPNAVICGMGDCEKVRRDMRRADERKPPYHFTALVDGDQPIFVHFGPSGTGSGHGEPMTAKIDDAAKDAVKLFESTIADPKAFAATMSARKDALLLGTEANERFVGAEARATLIKWGLAFKTVGGIRAGTTKSKTIAWVIADVDATSKTAKQTTPYRVSVIYEKTGNDWKIVQLHFT